VVFSSVTFLFFFLPLVLLLYHGIFFLPIHLGRPSPFSIRWSNAFLLLVSVVFYFWGERYLVLLFLATTAADFVAALLISGGGPLEPGGIRTRRQKLVLVASLCGNILILVVFKYSGFLVQSFGPLLDAFHIGVTAFRIALPIGISFFLFHSMSYTIDVYRGEVAATRNFVDYACYVLMFPQLVAGPIVRFSYVAKALLGRSISLSYFASGVAQFIIGLGKKVLIANIVGEAADRVFGLAPQHLDAPIAWIGVVAYTLQIYFDFSGYSDMAIGLGRMFGFELPLNFDYPYISSSVGEFWRRWHISLSTWFRDYVFIPLGGSRKGLWITRLNLLIVFFLCGLWHGAQWTFVIWGLYHGLFLMLERSSNVAGLLQRHRRAAHLYTLLVVMGGWVLFRSQDFPAAAAMFRALAGMASGRSYPVEWLLRPETIVAICCGVIFSAPVLPSLARRLDTALVRIRHTTPWIPAIAGLQVCGLMALLVASAIRLVSGTHNPFIYFRF
jgi:alginate O-acetyltransferase complex protein AlgI